MGKNLHIGGILCRIAALAVVIFWTACLGGVEQKGASPEAKVLTWAVSHPELKQIYGAPFTEAGEAHRLRTFHPWPCRISESGLPVIQPTVVIDSRGELFADCYSARGWEIGLAGHSADGGKTWAYLGTPFEMRFKVPRGKTRLGLACNGMGVTRDGTLLAHYGVQYNDGRKPAGGYEDTSYHLDEYVVRSADRGKTWDAAVKMNAGERELTGSQKCRFAQLPDGRIVLVMGAWNQSQLNGQTIAREKRFASTYFYTSRDDGRTWQRGEKPVCVNGVEPDLLVLPSGRLLLAVRYQRHKLPDDPQDLVSPHRMRTDRPPFLHSKQVGGGLVARFTAILYSDDSGETWTEPRLVTGFDEQTGCLLRMRDGMIVLPFGYKTDSGGQRFVVSCDQGETWSRTVFQLHTGGQYASSVVLADDTIVTVIHDSASKSLQALRWRAPPRSLVEQGGFWSPRVAEPLGRPPRE